jgi:hypothetical protein
VSRLSLIRQSVGLSIALEGDGQQGSSSRGSASAVHAGFRIHGGFPNAPRDGPVIQTRSSRRVFLAVRELMKHMHATGNLNKINGLVSFHDA